MSRMNVWRVLEFLMAVHKAVEKAGDDDFLKYKDDDSPTFELLNTYKKCIGEIEAALEEVLLRGIAVDEIRLHRSRESDWLRELFGRDEDAKS